MHWQFLGMTGTGKTWSLKRLAKPLLRRRQIVAVWSGVGDYDWPRGVRRLETLEALERFLSDPDNFGAHVMIDEASVAFVETKESTHPNLWRLARMGRHRGFTAYYASQYPTSIPPGVRTNCQNFRCFRLANESYASRVVNDYGLPKSYVEVIKTLKPLHYLQKIGGGEPVLKRL